MEVRRNDEHRDIVTKGNQIFIKTSSSFAYNRAFHRNREKIASRRLMGWPCVASCSVHSGSGEQTRRPDFRVCGGFIILNVGPVMVVVELNDHPLGLSFDRIRDIVSHYVEDGMSCRSSFWNSLILLSVRFVESFRLCIMLLLLYRE